MVNGLEYYVSHQLKLNKSYSMMHHYILEVIPSMMELLEISGMKFIIIINKIDRLRYSQNIKKISNFRYYNFRLSPDEVQMDFSVKFIFRSSYIHTFLGS